MVDGFFSELGTLKLKWNLKYCQKLVFIQQLQCRKHFKKRNKRNGTYFLQIIHCEYNAPKSDAHTKSIPKAYSIPKTKKYDILRLLNGTSERHAQGKT